MNVKEIKEMINLMNENNLTELEIEKDGTRIKLKKAQTLKEEAGFQAPIFVEKEKISPRENAPQEAEKRMPANRIEIKSPMVGTFYRSPGPEAPPFVEQGQQIDPGQVVCIIEAMKLMNEIKSEVKGKITEILVENAEPVEFGQTLFIVEPQ